MSFSMGLNVTSQVLFEPFTPQFPKSAEVCVAFRVAPAPSHIHVCWERR